MPDFVSIFEIKGPFFYAVSHLLDDALTQLDSTPRYFILRLQKVPLMDATGVKAMKTFAAKCKQKGIIFLLTDVKSPIAKTLHKESIEKAVGKNHISYTLMTH